MFDFFTDSVENVLNVTDSLISGEDITKHQVAKLVSDGMSIVAIASITGIAVETLENWAKD